MEGDYYDLKGQKVSSIRGGSGVRILFETNGFPYLLTAYVDGWSSPLSVSWHSNGAIRFSCLADTEGQEHGLKMKFYPDGSREYRRQYEHGRTIGESVTWWPSGALMSRTTYSNGVALIHERFDVNGVVTQREELTALRGTGE